MRERLFLVLMYAVLGAFALFCFIPFWIVFINSFADESLLQTAGYQFAEQIQPPCVQIFAFRQAGVSKLRHYDYRDDRRHGAGRTLDSRLCVHAKPPESEVPPYFIVLTFLTMLFGAGLVGFYMLIANWSHLKDSVWALILPYLLNPFYAFILVLLPDAV